MKIIRALAAVIVFAVFGPLAAHGAKVTSDLTAPQKRQATVQTAERLAQRVPLPALPADMPSPFNPAEFDRSEATDTKASASTGQRSTGATIAAAPATRPAVPATDREMIETLAARIPSTGTMNVGGKLLLTMGGGKRLETGAKFIASYDNQDYELELVAIDRTTFTLRYRGEEYTRPIKLTR